VFEIDYTPSFIYDENVIKQKLELLKTVQGIKVLFPLKSFSIVEGLKFIKKYVNGFAASSLFEAYLSKKIIKNADRTIHITTPGLRFDEIETITHICDYISFNSLEQWKRFKTDNSSCGIRINPHKSFIKDDRYNPCSKNSKLGVSIFSILEHRYEIKNIDGLHFHNNCESKDFNNLEEVIMQLEFYIPTLLKNLKWLNVGGGYYFDENNIEVFKSIINFLKNKYNFEIFFEPGGGIVNEAGCIISSVIDIFKSSGKEIAILDTSVNHIPESFEYQYEPYIKNSSEKGIYKYILAGSSCLTGDIFGEYGFDEPLSIGSKIIFLFMGAYTMVKASMFNGINLPNIYKYTLTGKTKLIKKWQYDDFFRRCGG